MGNSSWIILATRGFFLAPAAWKVGRRAWRNWLPCGLYNYKWYN